MTVMAPPSVAFDGLHYPGQFHEVREVPEKGGTRWPTRSIPGTSPRSSGGRWSSFTTAASRPMRSWPRALPAGRPSGRRISAIDATGASRAAGNRAPEQERIIEPERGNRRLKMEADVSKQAAPILARKRP